MEQHSQTVNRIREQYPELNDVLGPSEFSKIVEAVFEDRSKQDIISTSSGGYSLDLLPALEMAVAVSTIAKNSLEIFKMVKSRDVSEEKKSDQTTAEKEKIKSLVDALN